jgi:hypothetical protein
MSAKSVAAIFILFLAATSKANNPLTPAITVNLQDQGAPKLYDLDQGANSFLFRGVLPHKLGGLPRIVRFTLPAGKWQAGFAAVGVAQWTVAWDGVGQPQFQVFGGVNMQFLLGAKKK